MYYYKHRRHSCIFFWFQYGRHLESIFGNGFPKSMIDRIAFRSAKEGYSRSRLPTFTSDEIELVKGTTDFLGVNYYTSYLIADAEEVSFDETSYLADVKVKILRDDSWKETSAEWLRVAPEGFRKSLRYLKETFNNPEIIITENGYPDEGKLEDNDRIEFLAVSKIT